MTYLLILTKSIEADSALVAASSLNLMVFVPPSPKCVFPSWVWIMHSATIIVVVSSQVKDKTLIACVLYFMLRYCCARRAEAGGNVDYVLSINSFSVTSSPHSRNWAIIR